VSDANRRRVDIVREPGFVTGLSQLDLDELRARRVMCDQLDIELSYYRRMLHGRMDLLAFEMRRRAGEEDMTLLEALPRILSEGAYTAGTGLAERAVPVDVPDLPSPGRRLVDKALEDDFLLRLPSMSTEDLGETQRFLSEVEAEVSQQRQMVYAALDRLQAELVRRYKADLAGSGDTVTDG
jgi:hypothetical protein